MEEQEGANVGVEPELLYHYTTQEGLLGILASKNIWATHVRYLNDSSEFKRGLDIVRRHVKSIKIDPKLICYDEQPAFPIESIEETLQGSIRQLLDSLDKVNVFVTSFFDSEQGLISQDAGDDLGQWRAYAGGTSGFSVGIDKAILATYIGAIGENPTSPTVCGTCNYDEGVQESYMAAKVSEITSVLLSYFNIAMSGVVSGAFAGILKDAEVRSKSVPIEQLLAETVAQVATVVRERFNAERDRLFASMIPILVRLVIPPVFMKDPAFAAEREWRIARFDFESVKGIKFRPGLSSLIPYVEIPLPLLDTTLPLVKRIVVGPSAKIDDAVSSARMLLKSLGFAISEGPGMAGVEVIPSKIPYRNW